MITFTFDIEFVNMLPANGEKLLQIYNACKNRVCTDTRKIEQGALFFCLKGGNFDGNEFAHDALKAGAAYVVADDPQVCTDSRILYVQDSLLALQNLAHNRRKHMQKTVFLGIGGSNGKTTTKELCLQVLQTFKISKATFGNLNNHIGVPLTILELPEDTEVAIIEMGTNHPGEMKVLCDIAEVDMGIVTNVGKEHLEGFKDLEGVAREESELYLQLARNNGKALVNADDPWLGNMAKRLSNQLTFGLSPNCDVKAVIHSAMPYLQFELWIHGKNIGLFTAQIGGEFNIYNILAAIAAGVSLGAEAKQCALAACAYKPGNNRSEWKEIKNKKVLLDAYNANPSSVEVALRSFATLKGRKAVMLGDMLELGSHSQSEHLEIFKLCQVLGFEEIYLCGQEFMKVCGQYPLAFENSNILNSWLKDNPGTADFILLKGSRGMKMEILLDALSQ
jgi:UDP-N-acetylmuramoyl-tripeptide--D-alanyl-D-alanine ligase